MSAVALVIAGCTSTSANSADTSPTSANSDIASSATAAPVPSAAAPSAQQSPNSANLPANFQPISASAVDGDNFWVLGYAAPDPDGGFSVAPVIARTTDGGRTFSSVIKRVAAAPNALVIPPGAPASGGPTISDILVADASHGWLYGNAAFETDDGGATWSPLTDKLPGAVVGLAASKGSVWGLISVPGPDGSTFSVYRAKYSSTDPTGEWTEVKLPFVLKGSDGVLPPSLVSQGGSAYLLAPRLDGATEADAHFDLMQLNADDTVSNTSTPCTKIALNAQLSAATTPGTLWVACGTQTTDGVFVSSNSGHSWKQAVTHGLTAPPLSRVGAISAAKAVVATIDLTNSLMLVAPDGTKSDASVPHGDAYISSIEFTDTTHGLAVARATDQLSSELWRTTDGGVHWSTVEVHR